MSQSTETVDLLTNMALVGLDDAEFCETAVERLTSMGYLCHSGGVQTDILTAMRMQRYQIVLIPEAYVNTPVEANEVLNHIADMGSDARREMFCAVVGNRLSTGDELQAFCYSVDMVIHISDVANLDQAIQLGLSRKRERLSLFSEIERTVEIE